MGTCVLHAASRLLCCSLVLAGCTSDLALKNVDLDADSVSTDAPWRARNDASPGGGQEANAYPSDGAMRTDAAVSTDANTQADAMSAGPGCAGHDYLFCEDFEGLDGPLPQGWSIDHGWQSGDPTISDAAAHSGSRAVFAPLLQRTDRTAYDTRLITLGWRAANTGGEFSTKSARPTLSAAMCTTPWSAWLHRPNAASSTRCSVRTTRISFFSTSLTTHAAQDQATITARTTMLGTALNGPSTRAHRASASTSTETRSPTSHSTTTMAPKWATSALWSWVGATTKPMSIPHMMRSSTTSRSTKNASGASDVNDKRRPLVLWEGVRQAVDRTTHTGA